MPAPKALIHLEGVNVSVWGVWGVGGHRGGGFKFVSTLVECFTACLTPLTHSPGHPAHALTRPSVPHQTFWPSPDRLQVGQHIQ